MTRLRERPTARVVLLDERDRILLMKGRLPRRAAGEGAWFTIGGGVEAGESFVEAAAREIQEETGILDAVLGPVVWTREGVLHIPEARLMKECYVLARCSGAEPRRGGWTALEHELIDDIRWWSLDELMVTTERVFPPGLARLLPPLLSGRLPVEPIVIPWE